MLAISDCACFFMSKNIIGSNLATIEFAGEINWLVRCPSMQSHPQQNEIADVPTNLVENCFESDGIGGAPARTSIWSQTLDLQWVC